MLFSKEVASCNRSKGHSDPQRPHSSHVSSATSAVFQLPSSDTLYIGVLYTDDALSLLQIHFR